MVCGMENAMRHYLPWCPNKRATVLAVLDADMDGWTPKITSANLTRSPYKKALIKNNVLACPTCDQPWHDGPVLMASPPQHLCLSCGNAFVAEAESK